MRRLWLALAVCVLAGSWAMAAGPELKSGEITLSARNVKVVAGGWFGHDDTISIAGKLYEGYGRPSYDLFATWDVRGWDRFQAFVGINDNDRGDDGIISIEVDGEQLWRQRVAYGQKSVPVEIVFSGKQTLTIRREGSAYLAEPKLSKGPARPRLPQAPSGIVFDPPAAPVGAAPFAVDPKDLKTLADALRMQVNESPTLAQRMVQGQVAIATFNLIDIPSPSVAQNVAEDLATAMIKAKFQLVERGQLDKVLKELKVQSFGAIDPATAQKIGQLSGCNIILVGSISDRGQFVVVNARMMETATGKSVVAEQVEMRKIVTAR